MLPLKGRRMPIAYDVITRFWRLATKVFFKQVEVVGDEHIPTTGPVVFVGNHPNSLMDPMLVVTTCHARRIRFAAKDVLFQNPLARMVLNAMGAVPIKRKMDHKDKPISNEEAFAALHAILDEGGAFGIFPEGISHFKTELQPLKTGAARLVLEAHARGVDVAIVPVGLNYRRRTRMRTQVLVQYGAPFFVTDAEVAQQLDDDAKEAVAKGEDADRQKARSLTELIDDALRAQTVNAPDFETLRTLDTVRRLYAPTDRRLSLSERSELHRRLLDHYERLQHLPEIKSLYDDVVLYNFKLDALGLKDRDLRTPLSRLWGTFRVARHLFRLGVMVPVALPGLALHLPVLATAVLTAETLVSRKDVHAATKLFVATGLVVSGYIGIMAWVLWTVPFPTSIAWASLALLGLLASGYAAISVLERQKLLRHGLKVLMVLLQLKREVQWLRARREALAQAIHDVVDRYVDPSLDRIVASPTDETTEAAEAVADL